MNNNDNTTSLLQLCVTQENFLDTSECTVQSRTASRTTCYINYSGATTAGRCTDNFDMKALQELGCYRDCTSTTKMDRKSTTSSFLGKRICRHSNRDISISLERSYYYSTLKSMNLDDSSKTTSTPSLRRPPVQQASHLDPDRHHVYRKVVGMLIWAAQVRLDPQVIAKDHTRHLASQRVGLTTSEAHASIPQKERRAASSSSHLDNLKVAHYLFDS